MRIKIQPLTFKTALSNNPWLFLLFFCLGIWWEIQNCNESRRCIKPLGSTWIPCDWFHRWIWPKNGLDFRTEGFWTVGWRAQLHSSLKIEIENVQIWDFSDFWIKYRIRNQHSRYIAWKGCRKALYKWIILHEFVLHN